MPTVLDEPTVKLIVLDHPFQDGTRERTEQIVPVTDGLTLRDVLPERVTAEPGWTVVEHGRVIPPDEWAARFVAPSTELVCYRRVHGAVGRIIAGALLIVAAAAITFFSAGTLAPAGWGAFTIGLGMMGVGMMAGGIADLIIGAPTTPLLSQSSSESSPTYGFSGIKNSLRIGAPIPVVYGEHRVAGQIVQVFTRAETTATNLSGTGTMEIVYTESYQVYPDDYGQEVQYLTDQWMQVTGTGTSFLSALPPGSRFRAGGHEFTVREVASDVSLKAYYSGQSNVPSGTSWTHIRNVPSTSDNDVLYLLLALSEGEIESIGTIKIQGQAVANYRDVTTDTRLGTNGQSAITLFGDNSVTQITADAAIADTYLSYTTAAKNVTALELLVQFPQGLFVVTDGGGLGTATVDLEVEYKLTSAGSWTAFGTLSVSDAKRSVLRRNIRIDGLAAGQYDVRIRRTSPESTGLRRVDAVRRSAVSEIVNDAYVYPNTALLAVKALATDQISGGLPTITAAVKGVKVKVFSSATAFSVVWTDNPAWIVFDMLTHTRYGMGQFTWPIQHSGSWTLTNGSATVTGSGFTGKIRKGQKIVVWINATAGGVLTVLSVQSDTQFTLTATWNLTTGSYSAEAHRNDLDLQSFVNWAGFCNASVSDGNGGTEKRATCNMVFDQQTSSVWDAANKVCGLGLASLVKLGNYITVKYQQAETSVQLFTMGNIVKGSFKESFLPLDQRANVFEVAYLNAANDYEQEMITLEDPLLYTNSEQERKQTIQVYGATRSSHAARLARFYQNANRYLTRTIEFEAGIDAVAAEPGDVIDFQHDVPQWGFGGRVGVGSTTSSVVVDQPMTVVTGKTYQVKVRFADDTRQTKTVTNAPGTSTILTISGTWDGGKVPADGDVFAFGETGVVTKPYRLIAVERTPEFHAKLSGIEYNATVYDEMNLTPVNVVQFSSLPNLSGPPPQVTDLAITQLDNASILVTFAPPTDARYQTTYLYRMIDGRSELLTESRNGNALLKGFAPGELLVIRAVAVSSAGAQANIQASPLVVLNVQQRALPPDVSGLELLGQGHNTAFVGKDAKFQWRRSSIDGGVGLDSLGRELLGVGADRNATAVFKYYRIEVYNSDGTTLRRREYRTDPTYIYSYEKNYEDAQRISGSVVRAFTVKVWAQDIYNQLSAKPAVLAVSNAAPATVNNLTATATATGAIVQWNKSAEPDVTGYAVHRGTSAGFTPNASNQVYNGPSTVFVDDNLTVGTAYYYKVAAYDTFDESSLNYSGAVSATPVGVTQSQLIPGLRAVDVVSVLPTLPNASYPQGALVFLTTDNKLYRSTGSAWTTAVTSDDLVANAVTAGKIAAGVVTATELAADSVTSTKLATGSVIAGKIATNAITAAGAEIADATIGTAKIIDAAVTTIKIADANITTAKIADAQITTAKIADLAVTAAKIANATITNAQIANGTIGSAQIADAAIQTAQIGDLQVATIKIVNNAVSGHSSASAGGPIGYGGETTIVSLNRTVGGGSVLAFGKIRVIATQAGTHTMRLKRGATVLDSMSIQINTASNLITDATFVCMTVEAPTAGTYTYSITMQSPGGGGSSNAYTAVVTVSEYLK